MPLQLEEIKMKVLLSSVDELTIKTFLVCWPHGMTHFSTIMGVPSFPSTIPSETFNSMKGN